MRKKKITYALKTEGGEFYIRKNGALFETSSITIAEAMMLIANREKQQIHLIVAR